MQRAIVLGVIWILAFGASVHAQSVMANINYTGTHNSRVSGLDFNGLDLGVFAAVDDTGDIVLSIRHQRTTADTGDSFLANMRYYELSGNFLVPKFNHYIVAGVGMLNVKTELQTEYKGSFVQQEIGTSFIAPIVGLAGVQRLGDAVFNYSWRVAPRASRTERQSLGEESRRWSRFPNTGHEFRGSVTHMLRPRFGVSCGSYWRRFSQDTSDYGFTLGTVLVLFN